jgi:hypothetical protein
MSLLVPISRKRFAEAYSRSNLGATMAPWYGVATDASSGELNYTATLTFLSPGTDPAALTIHSVVGGSWTRALLNLYMDKADNFPTPFSHPLYADESIWYNGNATPWNRIVLNVCIRKMKILRYLVLHQMVNMQL